MSCGFPPHGIRCERLSLDPVALPSGSDLGILTAGREQAGRIVSASTVC